MDLLLDRETHRRGNRKREYIENIIRKISEQSDLEFISEKMLPFYREMFDKLSKFNLVVSARAMGKSYNISWGIIESLFKEESDILVVRKTQKSLSTSLFPEIREKLTHLEDFGELFDFKVNFSLEKITLTLEDSPKRTIHFKGSMNPLSLKSFKSLNPVKMIVFEEAEELNERDLREIIPSFREEDVIHFSFSLTFPYKENVIFSTRCLSKTLKKTTNVFSLFGKIILFSLETKRNGKDGSKIMLLCLEEKRRKNLDNPF